MTSWLSEALLLLDIPLVRSTSTSPQRVSGKSLATRSQIGSGIGEGIGSIFSDTEYDDGAILGPISVVRRQKMWIKHNKALYNSLEIAKIEVARTKQIGRAHV